MSAKIDTYTVDAWHGEIPAWRNEVRSRARPGTDGYTFVLQGKRSEAFEVKTTTLVSTIAVARQRETDYAALCGTFVVVEPPAGNPLTVVVLDVATHASRLLRSTDGSYAMVQATWKFQRTQ